MATPDSYSTQVEVLLYPRMQWPLLSQGKQRHWGGSRASTVSCPPGKLGSDHHSPRVPGNCGASQCHQDQLAASTISSMGGGRHELQRKKRLRPLKAQEAPSQPAVYPTAVQGEKGSGSSGLRQQTGLGSRHWQEATELSEIARCSVRSSSRQSELQCCGFPGALWSHSNQQSGSLKGSCSQHGADTP